MLASAAKSNSKRFLDFARNDKYRISGVQISRGDNRRSAGMNRLRLNYGVAAAVAAGAGEAAGEPKLKFTVGARSAPGSASKNGRR